MDNYERALKFIRAKQIMTMQIRGNEVPTPVHIPSGEFDTVINDRRKVVDHLVNTGQLRRMASPSRNGYKMFLYDAGAGAYDLRLLVKPSQQLTKVEITMRYFLLRTGLQPGAKSTMYFDLFLRHKDQVPELFFKVDDFARRVHTPVCNFHRAYRPHLTIDGQAVASIDVTTMQPLILGKVLQSVLPNNEFSKWINAGEDIYIKLQTASGLQTRDEGKKRFFEIAFSPASDALAKAFGNSEWVEWVNWYKCQHEPRNSHNTEKAHSNLAWLLQTTEVTIMRKIWQALTVKNIPFLSVHDEIIIKGTDEAAAAKIMHEILSSEFVYYKLNTKQDLQPDDHASQPDPAPASGEYSCIEKKAPIPAPVPDGKAAPNPAPPMQAASIGQAGNEAPANEATEGTNEWFISEAQKGYKRSMVRNAKDYYPAFIFSYRPTLRRVGIDEAVIIYALYSY